MSVSMLATRELACLFLVRTNIEEHTDTTLEKLPDVIVCRFCNIHGRIEREANIVVTPGKGKGRLLGAKEFPRGVGV